MERFLLFAGLEYESCGGFKDFVCSFGTKEQALEFIKGRFYGHGQDIYWAHISDAKTKTIVFCTDRDGGRDMQCYCQETRI